ncbi:MAG: hypothetical protein KDD47_25375, partial [Acidobacteria bacterium]|nr:hypothetical protein [Acidobacteriota bacterium]
LLLGIFVLCCLFLTVHNRKTADLDLRDRWTFTIETWIEDGYFANAGLWYMEDAWSQRQRENKPHLGTLADEAPEGARFLSRSNGMAFLLPLYFAQRIYYAFEGETSNLLHVLYGQVLMALVAALLGLTGALAVASQGLDRRSSLLLGAFGAVAYQTHVVNLASYWEVLPQDGVNVGVAVVALSLMLEEVWPRTTGSTAAWLRGLGVLITMASDPPHGVLYLLGLGLAVGLLRPGLLASLHPLRTVVLPAVLALGSFLGQLLLIRHVQPNAFLMGSGLLFRTGLDGDRSKYDSYFDGFSQLFTGFGFPRVADPGDQTPMILSFAVGFAALLAVLVASAWSRRLRTSAYLLAVLLIGYVPFASVFSQSTAMHPTVYSPLLLQSLCLAAFTLGPAALMRRLRRPAVVLFLVVVFGHLLVLGNLRQYATMFPTRAEDRWLKLR